MHSPIDKILVIEDTLTQRAILCNLIKELGITPICPNFFDHGIIETIEANSVKLVLIDLILLDQDGHVIGDGFQICSDIKSYDSSVKVVVISAEADEAAKEFALSQGADGFIGKPFKIDALEKCIQELSVTKPGAS